MQDIIRNVEAKGRRVKVTKKKNYLHEAVKEGGRKVASMYVIVVGCYRDLVIGKTAPADADQEMIKVEGEG